MKPETIENSAYVQSLSLEALGDFCLGFLGLTLVQIAKKYENLKALEPENRDRLSRFNQLKKKKECKGTSRGVLIFILI